MTASTVYRPTPSGLADAMPAEANRGPRRVNWLVAVIGVWLAIVAARATQFGGQWEEIAAGSWFALTGWLAMYAAGYGMGVGGCSGAGVGFGGVATTAWASRWITRLSVMAAVGSALIAYEFAVVRGYGFSTQVALIRITEVDSYAASGGSWISGAGRMLVPALIVAWLLATGRFSKVTRASRMALLAASAFVYWQQSTFEGGRFFLACVLLAVFAASKMQPRPAGHPQRRTLSLGVWAAALTVALVLFGRVFIDRVADRELDFGSVYRLFVDSFAIETTSSAEQRLDGELAPLWFAAKMLWMYLVQGPNQFNTLLLHEPAVYGFGAVQFQQIAQGLGKLTGLNLGYDVFVNTPNPGTYTTFVGMAYMDFGMPGAWMTGALLGYLTARSVRRYTQGAMNRWGLAAPLLLTLSLFSPVVSLMVNLWPAIFWAVVVGSTSFTTRPRPRPALAQEPHATF